MWMPEKARACNGIEEHKHRTDVMPRRDGQELVDAFLKTGGILLPEQVVEEDAHGVHAHRFGPGEFLVDLFGIEGRLLPHLQLVDGGLRDVIAADQPGLLRVPRVGLLLGPARCLRRGCSRGKNSHNQCRDQKNGLGYFHNARSAWVYMVGVQEDLRNEL